MVGSPALSRQSLSERRARGGLWSVGLLALACSSSQRSEPEWPPQVPASFREGAPTPREGSPPPPSSSQGSSPPANLARPTSLATQYEAASPLETFSGKATYYADSLAGNSTASGEPYDPKQHSAAHRKLPFGTVVRVIRQDTGAVTYVRVNDRGPFGNRERVIDLSRAAAEELEMLRAGVVPVRVEILERPR